VKLRDLPSVDELARGVDDPLAVEAARDVLARGRLRLSLREAVLGKDTGTEVVEQRHAVPAGDCGEIGELRQLREADDPKVRLVHPQQERRLRTDRLLVVPGARAVRRADLDEPGTRARQHVGDAEAVADLDQLAAGDDHLAVLGERREG
jgi:hypothetical protein